MKMKENHHKETIIEDITIVADVAIETVADNTIETSSTLSAVKFDSDSGKVVFTLQNSDRITLSPPKAKAFLLLQSWYSSTPIEERSDAIAMVRMAYYCISKFERNQIIIDKPLFSEWFDDLDFDDIEVIGKAVNHFRDILEKHTPKQTNVLLSK